MARKPPATPEAAAGRDIQPRSENDVLLERIEREIGPLVGSGQRDQIVARMQAIMVRESYKGPIPHPKHLREFDEILPGAAGRILAMAENAQNTNITLDTLALDAEVADTKLGMWMGFAALIVFVLAATMFGLLGNTLMAGLFLSAAALGAIGVFVNGRLDKA